VAVAYKAWPKPRPAWGGAGRLTTTALFDSSSRSGGRGLPLSGAGGRGRFHDGPPSPVGFLCLRAPVLVLLADFTTTATDLAVVKAGFSARVAPKMMVAWAFWSKYGDANQLSPATARPLPVMFPPKRVLLGLFHVAVVWSGDFFGTAPRSLVTTVNGPGAAFRNVRRREATGFSVRAYDRRSSVSSGRGMRSRRRQDANRMAPSAESYLCSSEPRAHFGLAISEESESIEILWPDGARETFQGAGGSARRIAQGEGSRRQNEQRRAFCRGGLFHAKFSRFLRKRAFTSD